MGKHSSPDSAFWRSVVIAGASRLGIVILILLVAFAFWRLVIRRDASDQPPGEVPGELSPSPAVDLSPEPSPAASPGAGEGRIQVLNGSGSAPKVQAAQSKLEQAGYEVAASDATARSYARTTVFYQPGAQPRADAIVSLLGLGVTQPAPENLDKSIPIAVVIGADYPG